MVLRRRSICTQRPASFKIPLLPRIQVPLATLAAHHRFTVACAPVCRTPYRFMDACASMHGPLDVWAHVSAAHAPPRHLDTRAHVPTAHTAPQPLILGTCARISDALTHIYAGIFFSARFQENGAKSSSPRGHRLADSWMLPLPSWRSLFVRYRRKLLGSTWGRVHGLRCSVMETQSSRLLGRALVPLCTCGHMRPR